MESRRRNVWIVGLVVLVVLALGCLCALAAAAGAGLWLVRPEPVALEPRAGGPEGDRLEQTFAVGEAPRVVVDNFAGSVTVNIGEPDEVYVKATKKALRARDLNLIGVGLAEAVDGVRVKTGRPLFGRDTSVELVITTPPDTRLEVKTGAGTVIVRDLNGPVVAKVGAGTVEMRDVRGEIEASTGAGTITVGGAEGPVRLENGAGGIVYQGTPQGDSYLKSSVGAIALTLPRQPDVRVDLKTSVGAIELGCPVEGVVQPRRVVGVIGSGLQGTIQARNDVGGIGLNCR